MLLAILESKLRNVQLDMPFVRKFMTIHGNRHQYRNFSLGMNIIVKPNQFSIRCKEKPSGINRAS